MVQVIQIKRKTTGAGVPATLAPGELAYNTTGHTLVVGDGANTVQNLVSNARQVELTGDQGPITGIKTFGPTGEVIIPVANLGVTGGNAGEFISTDGAGNLSFVPMISASQQFVGSADGATGGVTLTVAAGGGAVLPAPAPANSGWYVIYDVAGATVPPNAGAGVTGPFNVGDWLISNGSAWTHLAYGGMAASTAADIGVVAPVTGGDDVQEVLESLEAADATFVVGPAVAVDSNFAAFDTTTGKLIKDSTHSFASLQAAAKTYVDTANATQDTAQDVRDDAQDVLIAANAAAILTKGDVVGPALVSADGNIAVYDQLTGKLIKDSLTTVASITAAIAAKADTAALANYLPLAGGTVTGPIILPIAAPTTDPEAANKKYVDDGLASVAAGASVLVTAPELTGNGLLGSEITFTGITAEAVVFGGNGLSATPLTLLVVDGGEYV